MTDMLEQRRCQRGDRCLTAAKDDAGQLVPGPADRAFCQPDEDAIARALEDVPALYVGVRNATLTKGSHKRPDQKVKEAAGSPMPLNGHQLDLGEQVHWLLTTWEDIVRDIAGLTSSTRRAWDEWERTEGRAREGREVQAAAELLGKFLTVWLSAPSNLIVLTRTQDVEQAGWEAALNLLSWRTQAFADTPKAPKRTLRYDTPCMYCGVAAVCHRAGDDLVQCHSCWQSWDLELYPVKVAAFAKHITDLAASPMTAGRQ